MAEVLRKATTKSQGFLHRNESGELFVELRPIGAESRELVDKTIEEFADRIPHETMVERDEQDGEVVSVTIRIA